jgi:branched-chain amino acid transport system substrate-binding protein
VEPGPAGGRDKGSDNNEENEIRGPAACRAGPATGHRWSGRAITRVRHLGKREYRMKHAALTFTFAVAALGIAASPQSARAADDEIVIGFAIAQSGWMTQYDGPDSAGALLAIDDINAKGGIMGKKIRPVFADTKSDQTEGAKAGQSVLAQGAQFMVVSCDYDMGAGAATVGNDNKIPTFSLCASDAKMGVQGIGPYAFSMNNSSVTIGATMGHWMASKQNWKNAYLLADNTIEYSKGICAGFKSYFEKDGGKIVAEDTFKQDDASIASQVTRIKQVSADNKVDVIMICSYGGGNVSAVKQIRAAGIETPIGGADSMDGDFWTKAIPNLNDHYAVVQASLFGDDPRPFANEFFKRLEKVTGQPPASSLALAGYSVIEAFKLAIERAQSVDGDKVLDELNKFKDEPLAVGPTTYTPDLHISLTRPYAIVGITGGKGHFVDLLGLPEPPAMQLIFK